MRNFLLGFFAVVALLVVTSVVAATVLLVDHTFPPPVPVSAEPVRKTVMTTVFWVGEGSTAENGYISNAQSYWDEYWGESFGGVDDPENRCGYAPCTFTPKENPFYIALPYTEFNEIGTALKPSAKTIPWYGKDDLPLLKNRWVEVMYQGTMCYGQWQDVGPFLEDDFSYVFGFEEPKNTFGVKAGLDISPALWDCLGMTDNSMTSWRFVDAKDVPPGPWLAVVTTSGISWLAD